MATDPDQPTEAALLKMLELQWQDHFQTREQTWKSVEIAAALVVAVVGLDWSVRNPLVTAVAAILLAFVAQFGMAITLKHREVERNKFETIGMLERQLGLARFVPKPDLPKPISLWSIFNLRQSNNPLFILRLHFIILLFALTYLVIRVVDLIRH